MSDASINPEPLAPILDSVLKHLERVVVTINTIEKLALLPSNSNEERRATQIATEEIERSLIVLTHAILEDSLREIVRLRLKEVASVEVLSTIPLSGISQSGQPKKFGLEEL